ncbi:MAG TPA: tetratricopeptide repeat protein [Bacillales bacterium]|nr:tetratricopeptide repeat protein [Bacillales bacterium]
MEVSEQKEWLDRWYRYMKNQQLDNAKTRKEKIEAHLDEFTDPDLRKLYKLLMIRYHVMFLDLESAAKMITETGPDEENKYHWLNYYYFFFRGFYHLECREYKTAVTYFTRAKLFISDIEVEETAELYYKLAVAYFRTFQISRSIKYSNKALIIYEEKSYFKRIADCENTLGMNNLFIGQYKEALNHYNNALKSVEKTNDKILKMIILHNLGNLYTELNKPINALNYLNQAIKGLPLNSKCQTFYLITKNYFKVNQSELALKYLQRGLELADQHQYFDYKYHFSLLRAKYLDQELYDSVSKKAIDYFKANESWDYVIEYSEDLATHLRSIGNHKEAMNYFHLAVITKNQIKRERVITSA